MTDPVQLHPAMEDLEFKQLKKAYWTRIETLRERRDTLQSRHMTITSNLKKAQAHLDIAIVDYNNLQPPHESQK